MILLACLVLMGAIVPFLTQSVIHPEDRFVVAIRGAGWSAPSAAWPRRLSFVVLRGLRIVQVRPPSLKVSLGGCVQWSAAAKGIWSRMLSEHLTRDIRPELKEDSADCAFGRDSGRSLEREPYTSIRRRVIEI